MTEQILSAPDIQCSRESARDFVKLFWGIDHTPYWFQQTLTFPEGPERNDIFAAHAKLKSLLDGLLEAYPWMALLWSRQYQADCGIHFHVLLLFFGEQPAEPDRMRYQLWRDVWARWRALNPNAYDGANMMTSLARGAKSMEAIEFMMRGIQIVEGLPRRIHWNGKRRGEIIDRHSSPTSKADLRKVLRRVLEASPAPKIWAGA